MRTTALLALAALAVTSPAFAADKASEPATPTETTERTKVVPEEIGIALSTAGTTSGRKASRTATPAVKKPTGTMPMGTGK